jgi:hypothetical protein
MLGLLSKSWRLNHLYRIIDRQGNSIPFKLNPVQQHVLDNMHTRNLILKARQLGMSTGAVLILLDECLFNRNLSAGIVSYSLEHAQHIFKRIIGHALEHFGKDLQKVEGVDLRPYLGIVQQSAREITFSNGSSLRVDTTLRGGAYQLELISEFGKTCARSPQKAEEVITGTLNALPATGVAIIESTGEGLEGFFAEMCLEAHKRGNDNLTMLDYKLFFFPWYFEPTYVLYPAVTYSTDLTDYFNAIQKEAGTTLSPGQRNWYAMQCKLLGDKVKQEFPSTVLEAFLSNSDAYYFAQYIEEAYKSNRCVDVSLYDALLPVYIAMDIGVNDLTVIIFFQVVHGEIRVIDYYEDKNKGCDFYARFILQDKKYLINTIYLPHDSTKRDPLDVSNTYERDFKRLFSGTATRILVLAREDKNLSISHTKIKMSRCVYNVSKVKKLLDHLSKYRKKWSEQYGKYLDEPYHDVHSNYADAFRYMCQAVSSIETVVGKDGAMEKHKKAIENRTTMLW